MRNVHSVFSKSYLFSLSLALSATLLLTNTPVRAADDEPEVTAADVPAEETSGAQKVPAQKADRANVQRIKSKYWARGEESGLGVVQNRTFTKSGRFQIGLLGGMAFTDPFLNVRMAGLGVGYHFTETFSLNLLYWKYFAQSSTALKTFEETRGATANTNYPQHYLGGESTWSFLYGKLALFDAKIIYYDMNVALGMGAVKTESGTNPAPSVGVGQRFFLNRSFSLRLDYRLVVFKEDILEKQIRSRIGQVTGSRTNFSNNISVGIDFLFGGDE